MEAFQIPTITNDNTTTLINPMQQNQHSSFEMLNEFSQMRNYYHSSNKNASRCFWCHHDFLSKPILCPVRLKDPRVIRSYISGINNERYTIAEDVTLSRLETEKDNVEEILREKYEFDTDSHFCSVNCCLAYIRCNNRNPLYNQSERLLKYVYNIQKTLIPAPHWKMLYCYGGCMTIDEFRQSFDHLEIKFQGFVDKPIISVFEENIKL